MSSTEIYMAREDGEFHLHDEFHNSWRSAAFVWSKLFDKYGTKRTEYDNALSEGNVDKLFEMREKMTECEQIVLLATADNVVVWGDNLELLAERFVEFAENHPVDPEHRPSSLPEQAETLRELYAQETRPRAVAWNQTTVNSAKWNSVEVPCESCGCTCSTEHRRYSLEKDTTHFELFEGHVDGNFGED